MGEGSSPSQFRGLRGHRPMECALLSVNAAIARLTFLTNGKIGCDWYSGERFVLPEKGNEYEALLEALEALRGARSELEKLSAEREKNEKNTPAFNID